MEDPPRPESEQNPLLANKSQDSGFCGSARSATFDGAWQGSIGGGVHIYGEAGQFTGGEAFQFKDLGNGTCNRSANDAICKGHADDAGGIKWDDGDVWTRAQEPCVTYLMAVSQSVFWLCFFSLLCARLQQPLPLGVPLLVLGACTFHFCWAVKNRCFGPLWTDLGVITFSPGVVVTIFICASGLSKPLLISLAAFCFLIMLNFCVPVLKIGTKPYKSFAKAMQKSVLWAKVFYMFAISSIVFWGMVVVTLAYQATTLDS